MNLMMLLLYQCAFSLALHLVLTAASTSTNSALIVRETNFDVFCPEDQIGSTASYEEVSVKSHTECAIRCMQDERYVLLCFLSVMKKK